MIDIAALKAALGENQDWVVIDLAGTPTGGRVPPHAGPATLLVSEVADSLKEVRGGRVVASVDRDLFWAVRGVVLNRVVLENLAENAFTLEELYDAVVASGISWQIVPIPTDTGG